MNDFSLKKKAEALLITNACIALGVNTPRVKDDAFIGTSFNE